MNADLFRNAFPFWESLDNLDYSAMWEDDRLWLERAIKGDEFDGYFIFKG